MIQISDIQFILNILFIATIFGFLISFPIIEMLFRFKIVRYKDVAAETINFRENKIGTPIMGGLVIVLTIIAINIAFNLNQTSLVILTSFFIIALSGAIDDVLNIYGKNRAVDDLQKDVKFKLSNVLIYPWKAFRRFFYQLGSAPGKGLYSHERIMIQFGVAAIFCYWLLTSGVVQNPYNLWIPIPFLDPTFNISYLIIPIIIFAIVGMINGVNISDGMDGLAAGMLVPTFTAFGVIALIDSNMSIATICFSAVGGLIAYLYFNIPPARFQMGDVGALALGAMLAIIAIILKRELLLLVIGLPYVIEFLSSYLQVFWVKKFGKRLFAIAPIHYHFQKTRQWSEEKIVMRFILLSTVCAILGVLLVLN